MTSRVEQLKAKLEAASGGTSSNNASSNNSDGTTRKLAFGSAPDVPSATASEAKEPLMVNLRVRPLDSARKVSVVTMLPDGKSVTISPPKSSAAFKAGERDETFHFSNVFGPDASQQSLYENVARPLVSNIMAQDGNSLIFTFGVTNSGKTYTIHGSDSEPGILPRALQNIFNSILQTGPESERFSIDSANYKYAVVVNYLEIYNELIYDLLADHSKITEEVRRAGLQLKIDHKGRVGVRGLQDVTVTSYADALKVLERGKEARKVAETELNTDSSRSHSIFTIKVCTVPREHVVSMEAVAADPHKYVRYSKLSIIDLAGSERAKRTNNSGARLVEANNINQSLMTFKRCIDALRYNQLNPGRPPKAVPYRDSKMTRLFQDYFSGNGRAAMVVNINPQVSDYDETSRVLKFSAMAQDVRIATSRIDTGRVPGGKTKSRIHTEAFDGDLAVVGVEPTPKASRTREPVAATPAVDPAAAPPQKSAAKKRGATVGATGADAIVKQLNEELEQTRTQLQMALLDASEQRAEIVRLEAAVREEVASEFAQEIFRNQLQCEERVMEIREALEEKYERKIEILDELNKTTMQRHAAKYQELVDEWNHLADEKEALQSRLEALLSARNTGSGTEYHAVIKSLEERNRTAESEIRRLRARVEELEAGQQQWKAKVGQVAEARISQLEHENGELREENRQLKLALGDDGRKRTARNMWGLKKKQKSGDLGVDRDEDGEDAGADEGWANVSLDEQQQQQQQQDDGGDKKGGRRKKFGVAGSWRKRKGAQQSSPVTQGGAASGAAAEVDVLDVLRPRNIATPKKHKKQPSRTNVILEAPPQAQSVPKSPVFADFAAAGAGRKESDSMRLTDLLSMEENVPNKSVSPTVHKRSVSRGPSGNTVLGSKQPAVVGELSVPVLMPAIKSTGSRSRAAKAGPSRYMF